MTIEQYYRWINTKAGKKIKDFMNRLIPGLMPEPVSVRVPLDKKIDIIEDDEIKAFRFK